MKSLARSGRLRIVMDALILVTILVGVGFAFSTEASQSSDHSPVSAQSEADS